MDQRFITYFPNISFQELSLLQQTTKDLTEKEFTTFVTIYQGRRKDPMLLLILSAVGLLGFAGIHRFLLGQIGMGILYLLTAGLCFIGTIIDMVNYQKLALEHNQMEMMSAIQMTKMLNQKN